MDLEYMNVHSIHVIESLQTRLAPWESWIVHISVLGDNREAFVFFFPLLAGLSLTYGAKMLWAAVLVEWSNLIMKWIIQGDRPYWYVNESPAFTNTTRPLLRQFPNTCESGPGMPSGHIMMNVAIFYIFSRSICNLFVWKNGMLSHGVQTVIAWTIYGAYIIWVCLMFVSRLYIQAHFIHQCALGVIAGAAVGYYCWHDHSLVKLSVVKSIIIPCLLLFTSGAVWVALNKSGYDPLWSVNKALMHCDDPVHVRVDTQPFFTIARFTGTALGLGMGVSSSIGNITMNAPSRFLRSILACKAGLFFGRLTTILLREMSSKDMTQLLSLALAIHTALPHTIITTLPFVLLKILPPVDLKRKAS